MFFESCVLVSFENCFMKNSEIKKMKKNIPTKILKFIKLNSITGNKINIDIIDAIVPGYFVIYPV